MSGWLPSPPQGRDSRPPQFGEPPYEWQPSRSVEATYGLLAEDKDEYREFKRRADESVIWRHPSEFVAEVGDPEVEKVRSMSDLLRWARSGDELWLLMENVWAYFPDPLPYELHVKASAEPKFRYLGHFGRIPEHWQNIPQRPA